MNRLIAFFKPHAVALGVSVLAFLVYLKTLAPSVTFIDSGELAAVACTLGIAHPTGYPLFTLLGYVFSKLPVAADEIVRLNMMSALLCAASVFVFYKLTGLILAHLYAKKSTSNSDNIPRDVIVSSAAAALLLAFSETFWSQAVAIEVYSLHVLLVTVTLFAFFKSLWSNQDTWWYVFALAVGLSFTNHMTTILLAPGLLYLYFATQGFNAVSLRRLARMIVPFLIGFSVYLYLPLRAGESPDLNWGNPVTLERFLWHWTGKQYRVWIFSSSEAAGRQLSYFLKGLPFEFAYAGLAFAVIGIVALLRKSKTIAVGVLLLFAGCVVYSINYDIHDIDSYFLLAYISVALAAAAGLLVTYRWLSGVAHKGVAGLLVVAVGLAPCVLHYESLDESENYLVEEYTRNMFASVEEHAIVFSFQWDFWVSASYYYQLVQNVRPDVVVIDKELLRRSWYFTQLEKRYPWLIANSRNEVDAFLRELYKFEHDLPYDPAVIQARFVEMIRSMMTRNMAQRPVYVTTEIEPEFTAGMQKIPEGVALRLHADQEQHAMREVKIEARDFPRSGRLEDATRNLYATAFNSQGVYWLQRGNTDAARRAFLQALQFNPNSAEARNLLHRMQVGGK